MFYFFWLLLPSEQEQSISEVVTASEGEIIKNGEEQTITEEKQVEYVETWESYESTDNSEVVKSLLQLYSSCRKTLMRKSY